MQEINVNQYVKEGLKIKGTIDVQKNTAANLKLLENKGVQINLLLAGILDNLEYDKMLTEMDSQSGDSVSNSTEE